MPSLSRRSFLKKTGLVSALTSGVAPIGLARQGKGNNRAKGPKLVFMVSDGMSSGLLPLTDLLRLHLHGRVSTWTQLMRRRSGECYLGFMDMSSASGPVTDSSAAASSWGIGERIHNGALNTTPDGRQPMPILQRFRENGLRGGLVTTTRITHATPAGFLANAVSRNSEDEIAKQYLDRGADVLLGGGAKHFTPTRRADGNDLLGAFKDGGYQIVRNRTDLLHLDGSQPLLGLFGDDHLPYSIDHLNSAHLSEQVPSLAEMTRSALRLLNSDDKGFLLQVEAARVDHGAHANDLPATLWDQLAFDQAIDVVLDFRRHNPDTIVVITTDHGCANPGLQYRGNSPRRGQPGFQQIFQSQASYEYLLQQLDHNAGAAAIQATVLRLTGIELSGNDTDNLLSILNGDSIGIYRPVLTKINSLAAILANYTAVAWSGRDHTADYSPISILAGSPPDLPQLILNTDLFHWMLNGLKRSA